MFASKSDDVVSPRYATALVDLGKRLTDCRSFAIIKKPPEKDGGERGDLWRLALPEEEVIHMTKEAIMILLDLVSQGAVTSVTVNQTSVIVRIKK